MRQTRQSLLLHICCAPDATAAVERLAGEFSVAGYFHNPNIQPGPEYQVRLSETGRLARVMGFFMEAGEYRPESWLEAVRGLEDEPERGRRCQACFLFNLRATARRARELDFPAFTTTLTVSPHKRSRDVFAAGEEAGREWGVKFLARDFKKQNGFARSLELTRKYRLYRQNYCGCRFSVRGQSPLELSAAAHPEKA